MRERRGRGVAERVCEREEENKNEEYCNARNAAQRSATQRNDVPRNPTRHIARLARHEEAPALLPSALSRQALEVEQLADRTPPPRQQHLVHVPAGRAGPALERGLVAGYGGEVVPDPF